MYIIHIFAAYMNDTSKLKTIKFTFRYFDPDHILISEYLLSLEYIFPPYISETFNMPFPM